MQFVKYHGLGNDYLVMHPGALGRDLTQEEIRLICHRNYGFGSDGILWGPLPSTEADFGLRIFNPDGSEAEKSGNGLRIFSRYLFDRGLVKTADFTVATLGGTVRACVHEGGDSIEVAMGRVSFEAAEIPVLGASGEVLDDVLEVAGQTLRFAAATVGNPHCVLPMERISPELAQSLGPEIERHPRFPNRTNVQFLKVLGSSDIQIEIWERGAGYTLASGSSSSAAAAVAHRLGWCGPEITVHMPGGSLAIQIGSDFSVQMTGPVTYVGEGSISAEAFTATLPG